MLKYLNLDWNNLGVALPTFGNLMIMFVLQVRGGKLIGEGMRCNKSIASLTVQWCGFGDKGSSFIVAMLETNTTLESLDISGNGVSLQTCAILATMLQRNTTLKVTYGSIL